MPRQSFAGQPRKLVKVELSVVWVMARQGEDLADVDRLDAVAVLTARLLPAPRNSMRSRGACHYFQPTNGLPSSPWLIQTLPSMPLTATKR